MTKTSARYSPEVRTRAVRMVLDHQACHPSQWAAIQSIAPSAVLNALPVSGRVRFYFPVVVASGGTGMTVHQPRVIALAVSVEPGQPWWARPPSLAPSCLPRCVRHARLAHDCGGAVGWPRREMPLPPGDAPGRRWDRQEAIKHSREETSPAGLCP